MRPAPKTMSMWLGLAAALALLALVDEAAARPGGGHSYSGGSSSSSSRSYSSSSSSSRSYSSSSSSGSYSGGGGGGSSLFTAILAIGGLAMLAAIKANETAHERSDSFDTTSATRVSLPPRATLESLRRRDPEFSQVLFEDFVYALYARVHAARGDARALAALAPYVSDASRAALLAREPTGVKIHGVIIGSMQIVDVTIDSRVHVELAFESNFTAELPGGPQGHYIAERWVLTRSLEATSKPPTAVHDFHCPSCGGPYERSDLGRCSRCGQEVEGGRFDWCVSHVRLKGQGLRPPALTGDVQEQGTHAPSVREPDIERRHAALAAEDPGAGKDVLERRLREIYAALNAGWSACDLRSVRPHVSDSLFNYLSYWIDAYRAQGLRNVLVDMQVSRMEVVKLTRDRHYDAITLRIWARGLDSTVTVDGRHVSGDPRRPRAYSEYWTLIRGASVRGVPRAPGRCPNCGIGLDRINMAGNCEACGAHLTRGEFDWVLAKIEQDDSYTG